MPRNGGRGSLSDDTVRGTCTAVIGSMTGAMRAQSILAEAAIRAIVVKVSSSKNTGGCAYGVDFPCTQMSNAQTVLNRAGMRVREYLRG
ncbi:MAG: DUF3343 domain-containing protein [Clostridia bacterium]|nr:DUF3343 domain-containing protein [Clostridia bacterium]